MTQNSIGLIGTLGRL